MSEGSLRALVRRPGADLSACELTYLERRPVDPRRAAAQHAAYVRALAERGVRVTELEPLQDHPDAMFVEDCAVVLDELAVIARPALASRRGEVPSVEAALAAERSLLLRIEEPATLEGGDVVACDGMLVVGCTPRTNHAGLKSLAHLVLEFGLVVKAAQVAGCLHLKSALTYLGQGRLLVNPRWVDLQHVPAEEVLEVDPAEPFGANVLPVDGTLLCSRAYPRTNAMLAARGFEVAELELDELHKMEAAVTCPCLLFRGPSPSGGQAAAGARPPTG